MSRSFTTDVEIEITEEMVQCYLDDCNEAELDRLSVRRCSEDNVVGEITELIRNGELSDGDLVEIAIECADQSDNMVVHTELTICKTIRNTTNTDIFENVMQNPEFKKFMFERMMGVK